jgi:hypothetical protein
LLPPDLLPQLPLQPHLGLLGQLGPPHGLLQAEPQVAGLRARLIQLLVLDRDVGAGVAAFRHEHIPVELLGPLPQLVL